MREIHHLLELQAPFRAAGRRQHDDFSVGRDLDRRVRVDARRFEERLVEDEGEAVAGSNELLRHGELRTYSIVPAYGRSNAGPAALAARKFDLRPPPRETWRESRRGKSFPSRPEVQ